MKADFALTNHGNIFILDAESDDAREWADEHLPDDAQTWGVSGTVIDQHCIESIVDGIQADGLTIN